jgi:predicted transcriptional regulator
MNTNDLDLSAIQSQMLTALVNEYEASDEPVSASDIAAVVDRNTGTIRNQMTNLRTFGLVTAVQGPAGGYEPTDRAYDFLGREHIDERASVTLSGNYDRVDVTVDRITFTNTHHPTECTARVHFQETVEHVDRGDAIAIGSTPKSHLAVVGEVTAVSDTGDELRLDVGRLEAPLAE